MEGRTNDNSVHVIWTGEVISLSPQDYSATKLMHDWRWERCEREQRKCLADAFPLQTAVFTSIMAVSCWMRLEKKIVILPR